MATANILVVDDEKEIAELVQQLKTLKEELKNDELTTDIKDIKNNYVMLTA